MGEGQSNLIVAAKLRLARGRSASSTTSGGGRGGDPPHGHILDFAFTHIRGHFCRSTSPYCTPSDLTAPSFVSSCSTGRTRSIPRGRETGHRREIGHGIDLASRDRPPRPPRRMGR